jgi:hypothetical protein
VVKNRCSHSVTVWIVSLLNVVSSWCILEANYSEGDL